MGINSMEPAGLETDAEAEATLADESDSSADSSIAVVDAKPEPTQHVSLSRRERAAAKTREIESTLTELKTSWSKSQDDFRRELADRDQRIAQMMGHIEAMTSRAQPQASQAPSYDDLNARAREALNAGRLEEYERLREEAIETRLLARLPQAQQAPRQQMDPMIAALVAQHPNVMSKGDQGMRLAVAEDMKLAALGVPDGPARYAQALKAADSFLASQAGASSTPAFSGTQAARQALAGIPAGRTVEAAPREPGIELTQTEIAWSKRAGMSLEETAKIIAASHPDRVRR